MSRRLKKHAATLYLLARAGPKVQRAVLKDAEPALLTTVCECAKNILKGNVPLSGLEKRRLALYKRQLRHLADRRMGKGQKKRLVVQKGGFLPALLGPLIGTLAPLIGGLFGGGGGGGRR